MAQLIGLGRAHDVWYLDSKGGELVKYRIDDPDRWWAWADTPTAGAIQLVTVEEEVSAARLSTDAARLHRRFHSADPASALRVMTPSPVGPHIVLGLAVAVAYDAQDTGSASKSDRPYRHHFGDDGDGSQPPYSRDRLPHLVVSAHGDLFIRRRAQNTWRLDDWLRG